MISLAVIYVFILHFGKHVCPSVAVQFGLKASKGPLDIAYCGFANLATGAPSLYCATTAFGIRPLIELHCGLVDDRPGSPSKLRSARPSFTVTVNFHNSAFANRKFWPFLGMRTFGPTTSRPHPFLPLRTGDASYRQIHCS